MTGFIASRLLNLVITLFVASLVIFALLEIAPGDVAQFMMGVDADPRAVAALRSELGLNGDAVSRYLRWIGNMLRGHFGESYTYRVPVETLILDRLQVSLPLALASFLLSTCLALGTATWVSARAGSASDMLVTGTSQALIAIPNFWLAIMLLSVFSTALGWLPAGGFPGWSVGLGPAASALLLPTLALSLPQAAILTRVLRATMIETLGSDYIRTARAKGLSRRAVLWRHALKGALIPALPIMALQFSFLIAGGIIVETVFYLPGLGRLVFQAITQRDLIVVKGVIVMLVLTVSLTVMMMDIFAAWLDPRLRKGMGHV